MDPWGYAGCYFILLQGTNGSLGSGNTSSHFIWFFSLPPNGLVQFREGLLLHGVPDSGRGPVTGGDESLCYKERMDPWGDAG